MKLIFILAIALLCVLGTEARKKHPSSGNSGNSGSKSGSGFVTSAWNRITGEGNSGNKNGGSNEKTSTKAMHHTTTSSHKAVHHKTTSTKSHKAKITSSRISSIPMGTGRYLTSVTITSTKPEATASKKRYPVSTRF